MIHCIDCPIEQREKYESCDDNYDYIESWILEHDKKVRENAINEFAKSVIDMILNESFPSYMDAFIDAYYIQKIAERMKNEE